MKYLLVLLLSLVLIPYCANSQTELEIKTTGKYIFSWAYENSEALARETARLGILDTIFVSILKESSVDKTDTIFIKEINYFVKKIGFKWQAIAFADKSNVKVKLERRKQLKVIPVVIGNSNISITKELGYPDDPDFENKNKSVAIHKPNDGSAVIFKTGEPILDELINIRDANLLASKLQKLKSKLKLNYGDKSNYPDDTGCYIFIVDEKTLQVIAVYDKGKDFRKNFFSCETDKNIDEKFKGNYFIYVAIK